MYSMSGTRSIAAVITPDCDLIFRGKKRNAARITTVSGALTPYDGPTSAVSNFILIKENDTDVHYNFNWNVKDRCSLEARNCSDKPFFRRNRPLDFSGTVCMEVRDASLRGEDGKQKGASTLAQTHSR